MDATVQTIMTLVGSLGFPIVAWLLQFFQMKKSLDNNTAAVNELIKKIDS